MNITDEIKQKVNKDLSKIIDDNPEIQFYINPTLNGYQWKDSRFIDTSSVWQTKECQTISLLIESFKKHIDKFVF